MPSPRIRLWQILAFAAGPGISLFTPALVADVPHATQYSVEHSNGLWIGIQNDSNLPQSENYLLLDQGKISSVRTGDLGTERGNYGYTLGTDEVGHVVNGANLGYAMTRVTSRHDLSLSLGGDYQAYRGTTSMLDLDQQFSVGSGQEVGLERLNDFTSYNASVSAGDVFRINQTADAKVTGTHQQAGSDSNSQGEDRRSLDTVTAALEQRWNQSALTYNLLYETLLTSFDDPSRAIDTGSRQTTREHNLRYRFPLAPRLSGLVGYRNLHFELKNGRDHSRQGPEVGMIFVGETVNWSLEASELWDDEGQSETFAKGSLLWQADEFNRLSASAKKDLRLQALFPITLGEGDLLSRPREEEIEAVVNWESTVGRQKYTLSLRSLDVRFSGGGIITNEESLTHTYAFTPLHQMDSRIIFTQSRFSRAEGESRRYGLGAQVTYRYFLKGLLSATGGRMFVASTAGVDRFREVPSNFKSNRIALLLSLGQTGNF